MPQTRADRSLTERRRSLTHEDLSRLGYVNNSLPGYWVAYATKPDAQGYFTWYAKAPYSADTLVPRGSELPEELSEFSDRVDADTWPELWDAVSRQLTLYNDVLVWAARETGAIHAAVPEVR